MKEKDDSSDNEKGSMNYQATGSKKINLKKKIN